MYFVSLGKKDSTLIESRVFNDKRGQRICHLCITKIWVVFRETRAVLGITMYFIKNNAKHSNKNLRVTGISFHEVTNILIQ